MAKTVSTTQHDERLFTVHECSIDNGKTKIGSVAVPACIDLETMAELVTEGYFNEAEICGLAMQQLAIREQAKLRSAASPKAKVTVTDACAIFVTLSDEEKEEYRNNPGSLEDFVKKTKRESVDSKEFDPSRIIYLAKN